MEFAKALYAGTSVVGSAMAMEMGVPPHWALLFACFLGSGLSLWNRWDAAKTRKKKVGWGWAAVALISGVAVGVYGSYVLMLELDMDRGLRAPVAFMLSLVGSKLVEGVVELDVAKPLKSFMNRFGG